MIKPRSTKYVFQYKNELEFVFKRRFRAPGLYGGLFPCNCFQRFHLLLPSFPAHAMAVKRSSSMLGFLPLPPAMMRCDHSFHKSRWTKLLQRSLSRILLLTNRRAVLVKQLRRDVAQLLRIGQEQNARMRFDRVWKEQNLLDAYVTIGQYCRLVFANLSTIAEQQECPEDLREPLASLTFAASSCADLPELQELRDMVAKKYGKEFVIAVQELRPDCHVNKKLLETFSFDLAPSELVKQALLEEIAAEYNGLPNEGDEIPTPHEDLSLSTEAWRWHKSEPESPEPEHVDHDNLKEDDTMRNSDPSNLKMIVYPGQDAKTEGTLAIPHARSYGYHPGKAISRIVSAFLHALQGAFRPRHDRHEAEDRIDHYNSQTAISRKQSWHSHEDQYNTSGQDVDSLHTSAHEGMQGTDHQALAITSNPWENKNHGHEGHGLRSHRSSKGKRSSRSIINGGDMVQATSTNSSANHDNRFQTDDFVTASSVAQFLSSSLISQDPPQRPPPPPPHRVASLPTLPTDSPPPVFHQRSSTLESDRFFTQHQDYHVHPKLPQYEDLVASFSALKRKTPQT